MSACSRASAVGGSLASLALGCVALAMLASPGSPVGASAAAAAAAAAAPAAGRAAPHRRELRQRPAAVGERPARQVRQERRRQRTSAHPCEDEGWSVSPGCRRRLPCDLRSFDPGPAFNREVLAQSRPRQWAKNNVDAPNRYFQNGLEWWLHRALPPATTNATEIDGARRVFVAVYFSYMFIFAPHKVEPSLSSLRSLLGHRWTSSPTTFAVAHGHPGACVQGTRASTRLLVDDCSSCAKSPAWIAVPYVVARPAWLVSAQPPPTANRSILLFFRGHLPKGYIEEASVRRRLLQSLQGLPGVVVEAATSEPGASYEPHAAYLTKMVTATFCLSPRGDTSSSKRTYESIAAGCIPVIIADDLRLPFARRLQWDSFSVRISEREALRDPPAVVRRLRALSPTRVAQMQQALARARPNFLWHQDPSRRSAVDAILQEMCDGPGG